MSEVGDNLLEIRRRMAQAAARAGRRRREEITLVAVSKKMPVERLRQAVAAGQTVFGENYLQEAEGKIGALSGGELSWHFIGKLQSNKAGKIAALFAAVETVDRPSLAWALEGKLASAGMVMPVYIQVNIGREPQKSGVVPEGLDALAQVVNSCPHLCLAGLMTLPPQHPDPEASRPYFRKTRELADSLLVRGRVANPLGLSMGMSHDYEVAIEEGATLVRVGSALFGPRG